MTVGTIFLIIQNYKAMEILDKFAEIKKYSEHALKRLEFYIEPFMV